MSRYYILVGRQVVSCSDVLTWGHWFETADRHVKLTEQGDVWISTVFLGLDHGYLGGDNRLPVLFETMVFQGEHGGEMERYCTWEEAEAGHCALGGGSVQADADPQIADDGESLMGILFDDAELERMTEALMDEGRVLEAGWTGFRAMCLPYDASDQAVAAYRRVYFIGAKCLMTALEVSKFRDKRVAQLQAELNRWDAFGRETKRRAN